MIVRKLYTTRKDGVKLYITYSDSGMKIEQSPTGILYDSAIDVENAPYTYTETSEPVDEPIDPDFCNRTYTETDIPIEEDFDINENNEEAIKNLLATGLINIPTEEDADYFNENEEEVNYFE